MKDLLAPLEKEWEAFRSGSPREIFHQSAWLVFLIWSTVGLFIMATGLSGNTIAAWPIDPALRQAALTCLHWGDFLFLFFGAVVVGTTATGVLPKNDLIKAIVIITVGSGVVETIGTLTSFPFGAYTYMHRMGPQIGPLPLAIPVAWWLVVGGFYLTARRCLPHLGRTRTSLITAAAATGFDWIMEPFAWHVRGYWVWHEGAIPLQNYVSWFVLSFVLARFSPLHTDRPWKTDLRAAGVLLLTVLLFVIGRLAATGG